VACAVCFRCERGFGIDPRLQKKVGPSLVFCSMDHMQLWEKKKMDWAKEEDQMLFEAGKVGGKYLESINTFDLRKLSKEQWLTFLRVTISEMANQRLTGELNDEIPF